MIETKAEVSKDLEKALPKLQRAKQRVVNEKSRTRRNGKQRTTTVSAQCQQAGICGGRCHDLASDKKSKSLTN